MERSFFYLNIIKNNCCGSKSAANFSYLCSATATEASEVHTRLLELSTGILQSNHAHSILLRELISRQDDLQARVLDEIRSFTSNLGGTNSSTLPTLPLSSSSNSPSTSSASHSSGYPDNSDNASFMSNRSSLSLRLGRPTGAFIEDLKESRA